MFSMKVIFLRKKLLVLTLIIILICILLSVNVGGGSYANVYLGFSPRLVPIYEVDTSEKNVAITIDTAWGADKTLDILEILKSYNINVTFFVVGFWVEDYPDIMTKLVESGVEIGTHSNTHPDMTKLSSEQITLELNTSINLIKQFTNKDVTLFRAPFGAYNNNLLTIASGLDLTTIQWNIDTLDWKGLDKIAILNRVEKKLKNGSIILFHNNSNNILNALPIVIENIINKGYNITTVSNLIYKENYKIDNLGIQRKI